MPALRIEGYVIVSADGMLADARNVMPDELKFEGDKAFFTAALDRADLILHGRNSYEDQPNSPRRRRIILTRTVEAIAPDPSNPKSTLWNPAGASFEAACNHAGVDAGTVAVIGGPGVFGMFMDRYDAVLALGGAARPPARRRALLSRRPCPHAAANPRRARLARRRRRRCLMQRMMSRVTPWRRSA